MIGLMFNLLEDHAKEGLGLKSWYDALREATGGIETVFISPESYPDEEFARLVEAVAKRASLEPSDWLRGLGAFAFLRLAQRFPHTLKSHASARSFLRDFNGPLYDEVRRLHPDARLPEVGWEESGERMIMTYRSPRRLCFFAEGMLDGLARWFSEPVERRQTACSLAGHPVCRFEVTFGSTHG